MGKKKKQSQLIAIINLLTSIIALLTALIALFKGD